MAASGNATYTIDIAARITQYQEELKKIKQAADKLDIGAGIGKKIADALKTAEQQMSKFAQNTSIKVSNNNQIDRTVQQVDQLGESVSRIGGMLQQVTIGDLDLSKFDSSTQAVITRIRELEKIISSDYTAAIQSFVKSTPELTNFFNSLGQKFNARTASPEQFLGVLRERAEKAAEAFQQLDSKLQETDQKIVQLSQEKLDLQQSVFSQSSAANLATQVDQMMPPIEKLKQLLTKKLGGTSLDSQKVIDNFFTGLTPENFKKHFEKMLNDANLAIRQVTGKKRGSLTRSQLFEALGISGLDDPNAIASLTTNFVDQFKQFLDNLNASGTQGRINPADISAIKTLIDQGDWQKVVERTKQLITQGYKTNEALIAQKDKELEKALKDKSSLTAKQEAASAEAARTNQDFQNGLTQIQGVEEKQKDNIDKLGDSYKDLADKQQAAVDSQHRVGRSAQEAAASLRVTNSEVNAYREGLEKAKNAEQLIGRIQGLIQRWFSVYSVVRMVTNAVKEVINTVKELDKTITDIAIVTNMSHSDLWGQMESYSDLAKQYGTSISGAYKVSQLYYQQGLQTNDVLGLTAETLKMARIAGMEYEDATNLMTNALRSFKMEMSEANRVTDVYAALAASSASSVEELAEAMSKTASSAQAVGSSFENTSAMMAVMIEATREAPENIGSAMKSIISRYGELKTNPNATKDEEGEALSLNKVDTALQSVGITLQDVNGQFRNFDDVIGELGAKWDTIDVNTQRYIATIMAGNRQQSRFLALVSSYERYQELSEKAANSANAAQLQFLKTMDSAEYKLQQFQTTIQQLYLTTGVENFYKTILDFNTKLATTFAQLDKIGNVPLLALTKLASGFSTVAILITHTFTAMKNHYIQKQAEMTMNSQIEAERRELISLQEKEQEIQNEEEKNLHHQKIEQQMTKISQMEQNTRIANTIKAANKWKSVISGVGMAVSAVGMGISSWGSQIDVNENAGLKAGLTGAGGALSGIGMLAAGGVSHNPMMIVTGLTTVISTALEVFDIVSETAEEKIARLKKQAEDANNKALQSSDEVKTLKDYKKKYDELVKSQYKSVEAKQEFLDLNNEIAKNYPALIAGMDAEGNYIVNLTDRYKDLLKIKQQTNLQDILRTGEQNVELAVDFDVFSDTIEGLDVNSTKNTKFYNQERAYGNFLTSIDKFTGIASGLQNFMYSGDRVIQEKLYKGATETLLQLLGFNYNNNDPIAVIQDYLDKNPETDLTKLYDVSGYDDVTSFITEGYGFNIDQLTGYATAYAALLEGALNESAINYMTAYFDTMDQELTDIEKQLVMSATLENLQSYIKDNWQSIVQSENINDAIGLYFRNFFILPTEGFLSELEGDNGKRNEYLNSSNKAEIDNIYNNLDSYSQNEIKSAIVNLDDFGEKLLQLWNQRFSGTIDRAKTWADNTFSNDNGVLDQMKDVIDEIKPSDLPQFQSQVDNLLNKNLFNDFDISGFLKILSDEDINFNDFISLFNTADLTTLTGLSNFKEQIKSKFNNESLNKWIDVLLDNLVININTELNTMTTQLTESFKDFDAVLKKITDGMDISDAVQIANKLDISLDKFQTRNGKLFLDYAGLYDDLIKNYLPDTSESIAKLTETYHDTINKVHAADSTYMDQMDASSGFAQLQAAQGIISQEEANLVYDEYLQLVKLRESMSPEELTKYQGIDLSELETQYNDVIKILNEYPKQMANRALITMGNVRLALEKIFTNENGTRSKTDFEINNIMNKLAQHDYTIFSNKELAPYADLLIEAFKNSVKGVFDSAIDSIKNGEQQLITVDAANINVLQLFKESGLASALNGDELKIGEQAWIDVTYGNIEQLQQIVSDGVKNKQITSAEADSIMASIEDLYSTTANDVLTNLVKNVETGVDRSEISNWANVLSNKNGELKTAQDLINQGLFTYNEALGKYIYNLSEFEAAIRRGEYTLTLQQQNELLAELEQVEYDQGIEKVASEILNKRTKLTTDDLADLATRFGFSYDMIRKMVIDNGNDTFTMSLTNWKNLIKDKEIELSGALLEVFSQEIDNIISSVTGLASGNGYTKVEDITKFTNQFKGWSKNGQALNFNTLFEWSDTLNAYVLTQDGIIAQVAKARMELENADAEQREIAQKFLEDTGRQLANNINLQEFTQNMHSKTAIANFDKAIENYNAYLRGMERDAKQLDSSKLRHALEAGGGRAVAAARTIAKIQGNELSEDEIVSYYRSVTDKWYGTLDKILSTPGTIVDAATAQIIDDSDGQVVNIKGTSQYVVQVAADITKVYGEILKRLKDSGTATLAEINEVAAKALEYEDGEQRVIDALGDAANMTYSQFGEILANAGIELSKDLVTELSNMGIIKKLGGNKMSIIDFNAFANIMGWDANSDEYLSAFKAYKDSMIELNRHTENEIKNELSDLTGAKAGDWINLSYFSNALKNLTYDAVDTVKPHGNVNLANRPIIPGEKMARYYPKDGFTAEDYATIYGRHGGKNHTGYSLTPILEDGTVRSASFMDGVEEQIQHWIEIGWSTTKILNTSKKMYGNVILDIFEDIDKTEAEVVQLAGERAVKLHEEQALWDELTVVDGKRLNAEEGLNAALMQQGAQLEDGVLKLSKNADLLGVYDTILKFSDFIPNLDADQIAELEDARQNLIDNIANLISNAVKGSLNNVDVNSVKNFAKQYGVELDDNDFIRTSSGLKISLDKAGELYLKLKEIDSVAAEITFEELRKGLEESGRGAENAIQTTTKLKKLRADLLDNEEKLKAAQENVNTESGRQQYENLKNTNRELKEQIQLYQDLWIAQYKDPDSYNFMERDLPDIYKGPQNYWNSVGKMFTSMNEAGKSGYMALDDFYNIVNALNEMAAEGANIEFLGMKLDGSMESASVLIQKGMGALANVDGKGAAVALKKFGSSFSGGAKDMAKGVTDGVHLVAKSQIQMLDAMINVLETVVALGKLKDAAGEDNVFNLEEIFGTDKPEKRAQYNNKDELENGYHLAPEFVKGVQQLQEDLDKNSELSEAFESISIDGISLADLVKDASDGVLGLMEDYEGFQEIMNELITLTASDEYDVNDPFGSVLKILKKTVTKPMEITNKENGTKIAIGWGVTLETNKDGKYIVELPDGTEYETDDYKDALNKQQAVQQAKIEEETGKVSNFKVKQGKEGEAGEVTYDVALGESDVTVQTKIQEGKTSYTLADYPNLGSFDSQLDAMRAYARAKIREKVGTEEGNEENNGYGTTRITDEQADQYLEQTVGYTVPVNIEPEVEINESGKKEPITKKVQDKIKEWFTTGGKLTKEDGTEMSDTEQQEFLAKYGIKVEPEFTLSNDTSIDDRNKLLSAFGLSEEDTILNMTASVTTAEGDTAAKAIVDALNDTKTGLNLDLNITPKLTNVDNDPAINKLIELLQGKQLEITVKFVTGEGTPTEGGVDADGSGEQTITGDANSIIQQLKQLTLKADTTCIITLQDSAGKTYGTETNPIQINSPESASGTITLGKLVAVLGGSSTPGSGNANNTTNNAEFENPASEYDLIDANGQNITTTGHMNLSGFKASKPNGSTTATGRESAEYDGSTNVDLISPEGDFTGFLQILKLTAEQGSTMAKGSGQKKVIATLKDKSGNIIKEFDLSNLAEANAYLQAVKANEQSSTTYTLYDEDNNIESEIDVGGDQQKLDGIAAIGMLIAKKTSYGNKTYAVLKDQNGNIITKVSLDRLLTAESWSNLIYSQLTPGGSVQLVDANNNPLTTLPSKLENPANPDGFTAEAIIASLLGDLPANVPVVINGKDENGNDISHTFSLEEGQSLSDVSAEIAGFTSTLSGRYPVGITVGENVSYYWPGKALTLDTTIRDFHGQMPKSKENAKIYYVSFTTPDGVTYEADLEEDGVDLDTPINNLIALLPSSAFSDGQIQISSFTTKTGETAQDLSTQTYTLPSTSVIVPIDKIGLPENNNIRADLIQAIKDGLKNGEEVKLEDTQLKVGEKTYDLTVEDIQAFVKTFDLYTTEDGTNVTYSGWITGDGSTNNPWVFEGKAQYNIEEVDVNNKPVNKYDPVTSNNYGTRKYGKYELNTGIMSLDDLTPGQDISGGTSEESQQAVTDYYTGYLEFFDKIHKDIDKGIIKKEDLIYLINLIDMLNTGGDINIASPDNLDSYSLLDKATELWDYFEKINSIDTETSPLVNIMTLFSELNVDQILSFAAAMQSLAQSAAKLEMIKWALISEGISSINTTTTTTTEGDENGEPNIVETTNKVIRDILLTYTVDYGGNTYLEELFSNTLKRTVQVTMSYVNGGGDGGNGGNNGNNGDGGTTGNNNSGDDSGPKPVATATPGLNLDSVISALTTTEATAASVSNNIQTSISPLSEIFKPVNKKVWELGTAATSSATPIKKLSDSLYNIPNVSSKIGNLATQMSRLNKDVTMNVNVKLKVSAVGKITFPTPSNPGSITHNVPNGSDNPTYEMGSAKGNVALAKGRTLMGELGPELVVSNGHYFLAGENGAEMVDLADDAIVFNHLQTKKLLENGNINGRGQPITNERKATSFATGNLGPAMASAEQALAALKQLREMWKSLLSADAKSLGALAGRGGGSGKGGGGNGGGGGGGGSEDAFQPTAATMEIQRWYNLLRQIARLETEITYQETLQGKLTSDRVANGQAIYTSYKKELDYLDGQISRQKQLIVLQKSWLENRVADLQDPNKSVLAKIFTYDAENRILQYRGDDSPGSGFGLDILEHLNRRDINNQAIGDAATAAKQLEYLKKQGFNIADLVYNDDGTLVAKYKNGTLYNAEDGKKLTGEDLANAQTKMVENFFNLVQGEMDEIDSLTESIDETEKSILEEESKANEILQKIVDNQLEVEQTVVKAIEDREQKAIDELQKERDAVDEANQKFLDGLKDQLDKERKMYEQNEKDQELVKLQRQLAILQRSGGSAAQIRSLQDQISNKQRDTYFDNQEKQIDAIQEASDKEIERLDAQIDLMTETLEYQKEHGLLWNEVYQVMALSEDEIKQFVTENGAEWESKSSLQIHEDLRDLTQKLGIWIGYRDDENPPSMSPNGWETFEKAFKDQFSDIWDTESANAQRVYNEALQENGGDTNKADEAARKYLDERLKEYEEAQRHDNTPQNITLRRGDKGEYVKQLQQKLKDLGYNIGKAGVDGIFGKDTEAAIKKFQQEHNLSPDGIVGEKTLAALGLNFNNEQPATTNITLRKGNRGDNVKKLQKRLSELGYNIGTVDGIFGEQTLKAVQAFQKDMGLIVDGIVGKKTIAALGIHFKKGGLADFTGPAWLDGTKSRPEGVFDADTTQFLRNDFLKGVNTLRYVFDSLSPLLDDSKPFNGVGAQESINIQQAQVIMQVEHMNNDYDAQRAGEAALEEMLKIARKSGTRGSGRR